VFSFGFWKVLFERTKLNRMQEILLSVKVIVSNFALPHLLVISLYCMKSIYLLLLITIFFPTLVFAHPGGLDGNSCHHCWTNCEGKYGIPTGDYHCHATGDKSIYTEVPTTEEPEEAVAATEDEPINTEPADEEEAPAEIPTPDPAVVSEPVAEPEAKEVSINREDIDVTSIPLTLPDDTVIGIEEPMEIEFEDLPIEEVDLEEEIVEEEITQEEEPTEGSAAAVLVILGTFGVMGYGVYRGGKAIVEKITK
jgi:hypothetical protein